MKFIEIQPHEATSIHLLLGNMHNATRRHEIVRVFIDPYFCSQKTGYIKAIPSPYLHYGSVNNGRINS